MFSDGPCQGRLDDLNAPCYYDIGIWEIASPDETAPVAQWIEHAPSKRVVVGSNPAGRAFFDLSTLFQCCILSPEYSIVIQAVVWNGF